MADETTGPEPSAAPKTRSLLGYLPIILLVLAIQAVGAYFFIEKVWYRKQKAAVTIGQGIVEAVEEFTDPPDLLPRYDEPEGVLSLDEMEGNPAGTRGAAVVFFKVALGFAPANVENEIKNPEVMARIKDDVAAVFSSHPPEMMDQPDDKRALREEIKVRVNAYLTRGQIVDVYFEKFILQINE